jgi:hypothetical protein
MHKRIEHTQVYERAISCPFGIPPHVFGRLSSTLFTIDLARCEERSSVVVAPLVYVLLL